MVLANGVSLWTVDDIALHKILLFTILTEKYSERPKLIDLISCMYIYLFFHRYRQGNSSLN